MRLKYYKRTLRQMHINKAFVFFILFVLFVIFILFSMYKKAAPVINSMCEQNAKYIALQVTNEAVTETIKNIKYENLVKLTKDSNGKIVAINANVMELNRLSTQISSFVSEKLNNIDTRYMKVPLSSIFNLGILSGYGPRIALTIIPSGGVSAKFKSEFEEAGINQTRHSIFIEVTTRVRLIAPLYTSSQEYVSEINVAETVIVGDIPASYYNIHGVQGLDTKDMLNMLD